MKVHGAATIAAAVVFVDIKTRYTKSGINQNNYFN